MLAPLFLLWPMSVAITYLVAQDIANAPFDRSLNNALELLEHQIEWAEPLPALTLSSPTRIAMRTRENEGIFWKAQVVGGPIISGESALPSPDMPENWGPGDVYYRDESVSGYNLRLAYTWVQSPLKPATNILLVAAEGTESRAELANNIIKGVIIPQFLVLPLAVLLVWFGLSRGIAPINALQQRLRSRRPDDLSSIEDTSTPLEITPLVVAMNDLLARLSGNIESQRRFVADAAHQLKTPLAGLRTQAELALKTASDAQTQQNLHKIVASTERATRLINQLLLMASAEHPEKVERQPMDVGSLARQVCEQWVPDALEAGIDLGYEGPEFPIMIQGQSILLTEALNNLIDNALRYVPDGGHVTIGVNTTLGQVELFVRDDGPGIPAADKGRIFDRFYRVLGSTAHGSGLGLAIVKEIAQRHQAELRVEDANPGQKPYGTQFTITFDRILTE
ncbi:sensor histidine kinase [Orrella marina]|uniref:histidine kinase n=1 Tax=Orrella marina TaxID=2163011 RepID=A0A2R4XP63_9BURK|nr:sensor histidine kinase [Orrella marina]